MLKQILFIALCTAATASSAQKTCIAFYNQENLFDTIDDPDKKDEEFLPESKLRWDTEKYNNKIAHMGKVIASMNNGEGPEIIGLCEVENNTVLKDLVAGLEGLKKQYGFVHFESPDERSIDNALLYKKDEFKLVASRVYRVSIENDPNFKTRDILLVKLKAKNRTELTVLVNHFPSRLGGQQESEHKRFRAAQVLRHIFDSIKVADPKQAVIAIGDFNDEPGDKSIDSVLQARGDMNGYVYNAMAPLKMQGMGSHFYRKEWSMLDQIIMSKNMIACTGKVCYVDGSAAIYKKDWMLETDEKYKGAPLRTFAGGKYLNGYSDHCPVYMYVEVK